MEKEALPDPVGIGCMTTSRTPESLFSLCTTYATVLVLCWGSGLPTSIALTMLLKASSSGPRTTPSFFISEASVVFWYGWLTWTIT